MIGSKLNKTNCVNLKLWFEKKKQLKRKNTNRQKNIQLFHGIIIRGATLVQNEGGFEEE